jgi:hypothetical protein
VTERRASAVIISYKKVRGHARVTRMAEALAEMGRDVVILGLDVTPQRTEYSAGDRIRGIILPAFHLRNAILKCLVWPLNQLQRLAQRLR